MSLFSVLRKVSEMTYRIGRTDKLLDVLELTDESGRTAERLEIMFDIDASARDMQEQYKKITALNDSLHELLRRGKTSEYGELAKVYSDEVTTLFQMCFGLENTVKIMEFYENNCIEMLQQLVPYIFGRLMPKIRESVRAQKKALKRAFKQR